MTWPSAIPADVGRITFTGASVAGTKMPVLEK